MNIFVYSPQHAHTCQKPDVVVLNTYGCKFSVGHSSGRGTTLEGGPSRRPTLLRFNGFQRFWTLEHATAALQAAKLVVSPGRPGFWRALHGEKIVGTLREIDVPRDQHDIAYALGRRQMIFKKTNPASGALGSLPYFSS
jgi:hypothetical protein